jgi:hypothetical protein
MKNWVPAPGNNGQTANGTILGVSLQTGERVEWAYTILPDGRRVVTGYDILPVLPTVPEVYPENR